MIRIRRNQLLTLSRASFERTSDWIVATLREAFPDAAATPLAVLGEGVARQIERASAYSLTREDHVAIYVATSWVLGEDFPESFTAARVVLSACDIAPEGKVEWLETWTRSVLEELEQPEGPRRHAGEF